MSDKIKRLAKNLSDLIPEQENLQETYDSLRVVMIKQKDYFRHKTPEEVIKLLFYIWSYHKTNSDELGDQMLNNISFAVLFYHEDVVHTETCDNCDGEGDFNCSSCDGTGYIECDECDGSGDADCTECGGAGDVEEDGQSMTCSECQGSGEESCGNCGGDGSVTCPECHNSGKEICSYCDGNGEVDTDSLNYSEYFIVTWNKIIKDRCELTEDDSDITMSEYDFDRLRDRYVVLHLDTDKSAEFMDFVQTNEVYCIYYSDNPRMYFTGNMELNTTNNSINSYTKR